MNMYILSAAQFDQIVKALDDARFALDTCQHIELDIADPKKTIALPPTEKTVKASKSQSKTRKSSRKGKRGVAVLTEAKVLEIKRQLADGGKSVAAIARDFGVHITTINCIKWGKTWKNVQLQQPAAVVVAD
jgi:hypothetical protein